MPVANSAPFRHRCDSNNVAYKTLSISRITREWRVALRYVLFFCPEILNLAVVFRKGNFDLIHVSGGSWQFKGVIAGKLAGKKVLWHLNDTSAPKFIRTIFCALHGLADGFIFASERSRTYYGPLISADKPEFVVPAPVNTANFGPDRIYPGDEELLDKWAGKFIIGTVANINPIKGLEGLIRTAKLLKGTIDNAHFVVVGPVYKNQRNYYNSLLRLCTQLGVDNVEFVGGRSDVRPLLKRFDAYVCSSRAESSPIAVWEAMAMAKAVVSTDVGDVALYVRNGHNGFIVAVEDSEKLAERLAELHSSDETRRE
ncbi:MAG: hypothetical protein DRR42_25205, partial [Gammaproteobacteria bacterium]